MLLHLLPLTLHLPTSGPSTRRQHLQTSAAALAVLPPLAAHADKCETDGAACELVIPQQELLGGLASAPVRHVIVTGASSGVGLAGAKLLTAAGHQVTLACRTQAKADAAAAACMEFAASSAATGPAGKPDFYTGRRAGGVATGAACDLSSLASVRRSRHRLHCQHVCLCGSAPPPPPHPPAPGARVRRGPKGQAARHAGAQRGAQPQRGRLDRAVHGGGLRADRGHQPPRPLCARDPAAADARQERAQSAPGAPAQASNPGRRRFGSLPLTRALS